jgi:hypothetical protein
MDTLGGYDRLALLFSKHPELASFRGFRQATVKCLLYKQAELTYLESELNTCAVLNREEDEKLTDSYQYFAKDAQGIDDQRNLMRNFEAKLRDYRESLGSLL